ncbi:MAG: tRNA uridine-5-carboxymethylaminomethyl(34) synthesis GTPase MnmE [Planctomycetes bacterium]|nr:tRNA uridine-5-carboxymethylaminomethyl(34) synthesis GTPase MnmE [Planctomycetota bacterium]
MPGVTTTIAAIATPAGSGRRGILRLSGPRAAEFVRATLRDAQPPFDAAASRGLFAGRFDDGRGLQPVRVLWMRGPRSFTREDVAEFHLPGAEPLLQAALRRLLALGAVPARAGEFTRRAFASGRLDLSQAEGVLALTEAANEAERAAAALLLEGGLDARAAELRERLLALCTLCEASLDFDEGETGHVPRAELAALWGAAQQVLEEALAWETRRAAPSALARVLLVGAPNVGKSTLWNALTGGRALVSAQAGTTRDWLEGRWELGGGWTCLLIDGPGWTPEARGADAKAQELFARAQRHAELVLWVVDSTQAEAGAPPIGASLLVRTKSELTPVPCTRVELPSLAVSAHARHGLGELAMAVRTRLAPAGDLARETGLARVLFERHQLALQRARTALAEAGECLAAGYSLDLVAEGVRESLAALDDLSGRTTPEDVLERIFARFCLGK